MAKSNHGTVSEALEMLNRGLRPFVERELQAVHGDQWQEIKDAIFDQDVHHHISMIKEKPQNQAV